MTAQSKVEVAHFETTRRVLAQLVNEGLCPAFFEPTETDDTRWLCLTRPNADAGKTRKIKVHFISNRVALNDDGQISSLIRPHELRLPVLLECDNEEPRPELDPGVIFQSVFPWFGEDDEQVLGMKDQLAQELQNAAANQVTWLDVETQLPQLDVLSPAIEWERVLTTGHPTHPLHKTLYTQPPLAQIRPEEIWQMISPEITFLSVPRSQLLVSGPFEKNLGSLLAKLDIADCPADRIIVPTLKQQWPAIKSRFPDAQAVGSDGAFAQASMRTLNLRPELKFNYHLKLSLACQITSAFRTITPWTVLGGAEVSELLQKLLPQDMWVFREVAGVTGAQSDFNEARHLSCILREDLEMRANQQNESLIIASAFSQRPAITSSKWPARSLFPDESKKDWFEKYVSRLLDLTLVPLADHGIGLEAHGQNICVRICRDTKAVKGFAIRDFGGIRLHIPTLREQGFELQTIPPGAATTTDSLHDVWSKVHHSLFQNHIGHLMDTLGLEGQGGWEIVRKAVRDVLLPGDQPRSSHAAKLYGFLLGETMPFKCFLKMKMVGKYRDYVERQLPNVILS